MKKTSVLIVSLILCLAISLCAIMIIAGSRKDGDAGTTAFGSDAQVELLANEEGNKREVAAGDWTVPEKQEMQVAKADNYDGTLKYDYDPVNGLVTISYELNGEKKSYTVPNVASYNAGGYGGVDDLGRQNYTPYTVIDPDYTDLNAKGAVKTIDAESRTVNVVGENGEHYVGLFYFLWHGEHGDSGIFDIQKIIDEYGEEAGSLKCGAWGPQGAMHFFAEPLYGYYYAKDKWVQQKHMELLANANIDFLYFDVTNGYTYLNNALQLMEICHNLNEQGFDAPQVVFYTHTNAAGVVRELYDNIYAKDLYPDTWFCLDGKPVIIAPESSNINDFFTIRQDQWPNEGTKQNSWPWMDWEWCQRIFKYKKVAESCSISIAQHNGNCLFSSGAVYDYAYNRGRSFDGTWDNLTEDSYKLGLNFQKQFNFAIAKNVKVALVTGWNEWVAQRQPSDSAYEIRFVDTASLEFSRDAEMTRGGYFDNYYMQLLNNTNALKGAAPVVLQDARNAINVTGDFDQWDKVIVNYSDVEGDTEDRNCMGFGHQTLTNDTGRNDIISAKVTNDTTYMYFYVQTADTITKFDNESSWMQIYVNTDGQTTGWYGYDYIVNYSALNDLTTTVAKYNGKDGAFGFEKVGEVSFRVYGNEMMVAVPMEMLCIDCYDKIYVEFKCADSDTLIDEMEDFYIDGDAAPLGRLNFIYQNYIPGVSTIDGTPIVKVADKATQIENENKPAETTAEDTTAADEATTAADADETTAAPSDDTTAESGKSGCGGVVGTFALIAIISLGTVSIKRKH